MPARDKLGKFRTRLHSPFDAGWDSVVRGADTENCHFAWFSTAERTKEWELGVRKAKEMLPQRNVADRKPSKTSKNAKEGL